MDNKNIIKKLKEFIGELEKEYDVPSFADIDKYQLGDVLYKYRKGELDLKDYWKPGDTKITSDGCEYVILDIGYDKLIDGSSRTVTIMRRDLINLEVTYLTKYGSDTTVSYSSYTADFSKTQLYQEFKRRSDYYVGWYFNDNELQYNLDVIKDGLKCDVFILSVEEMFSEEKAYAYFKNPENRKLGNAHWTRTSYPKSNGDTLPIICSSGGYKYYWAANRSSGIVPCFVI